MKIGIFGGTFNPPHNGHLIVAETVRTELKLNKIIFIPSYISPHKREGEEILSEHRYAMTKLAIEANQYFDILDIELKRKDISYSIDTIEYIENIYPLTQLFVIIGMDNYNTFHLWKDPARILSRATLIVMNRPNYPRENDPNIPSNNIRFVTVPKIDIASSELRDKIKAGEEVESYIPPNVLEYIKLHDLYK